jgi:hypothetical protein
MSNNPPTPTTSHVRGLTNDKWRGEELKLKAGDNMLLDLKDSRILIRKQHNKTTDSKITNTLSSNEFD